MKRARGNFDRLSPSRQTSWDWRAAANFSCGGAGGGLLLFTPLAAAWGGNTAAPILTGLALVATGLTCVWFEIGRPWRALNVFRHIATSWMTRESLVAPLLFFAGGLAVMTGETPAVWACGLLGGAFLYSQARILAADKGIPAWRHPRCLPLLIATNLAEGAALLATIATASPSLHRVGGLLAVLLLLRLVAWRAYLAALERDGAPEGTLRALRGISARFIWLGNLLPAVMAAIGVAVPPSLAGFAVSGSAASPLLICLAGIVAVAAGWSFKTVLVRRAAFTQGFALPHLPVRGRGAPGAGVKPGWDKLRRSV